MAYEKIVRTLCCFSADPGPDTLDRLDSLAAKLADRGYTLQTRRLCCPDVERVFALDNQGEGEIFLSLGRLGLEEAEAVLPRFLRSKNVAFNVELAGEAIGSRETGLLFRIMAEQAGKTFGFTYTFNNAVSSPFFPSAVYAQDGFAVGLQPTNLAAGCRSLEEWFGRMLEVWDELEALFAPEGDYLGVDTSIAPLFEGDGSFLYFLRRLGVDFDRAVTSDLFLQITDFIRSAGPRKTGLCGLMLPCLEDFELAGVYEAGGFGIERNVFLALHSGLGIDAYPIGIDERPERVAEILRLVQGLSNKHAKPLSVRFSSDGGSGIGEKSSFGNPYLKDVVIRGL